MNSIKLTVFAALLACAVESKAAVIWAGGEDFDFQSGSNICVNTNTSYFRSTYARQAIYPCTGGTFSYSKPFAAGPVTSAWFSARFAISDCCSGFAGSKFFGIHRSGTGSALFIGNDAGNALKYALYKYDGTTFTSLASETGASLPYLSPIKIDVQITNYGAAGNVKVYLNGSTTAIINYTGNLVAGAASDLDRMVIHTSQTTRPASYSEFIVADTDTRNMSLATLAPSAAGTTNNWTGSYTDVAEVTLNRDTAVYTNTSAQTFQMNLSNLPAGSFDIAAFKISADATKAGSGISGLKSGVYHSGTPYVPAAVTLSGAWDNIETIYTINPVSAVPWTATDLNNLQLNFESAP